MSDYKNDPDYEKQHWPEYYENEGGDEPSTCPECEVEYFGFRKRETCYACHRNKEAVQNVANEPHDENCECWCCRPIV